MIQCVIAGALTRLLAVKEVVFLGGFGNLCQCAIESNKFWIKRWDKLSQECLGITLGIQGYKQNLYLVRVGAEAFHYKSKFR